MLTLALLSMEMKDALEANNYQCPVIIDDKVCALSQQYTTVGVVIGIDLIGYECRFCYKEFQDAKAALAKMAALKTSWPDGPWLKVKGTFQGQQVDLSQEEFMMMQWDRL